MRAYYLICPECQEEDIVLPAGAPDKPKCDSCGEEVDLEKVLQIVRGWQEYLTDREKFLEGQK